MGAMQTHQHADRRPFGEHLKAWRQQRRLSQLDLALRAEVSARHLSFVETGRAAPSREMVLRLSQCLQVPLRERNQLLSAAGFAPLYREHPLNGDALAAAREALQRLMNAHEPFPALALDRHWNIVGANAAAPIILGGPGLLPEGMQPNVIRGSHHPSALSSRIVNRRQLRAIHAERLRQQIDASADPVLVGLLAELQAYPEPDDESSVEKLTTAHAGVAAPFQIQSAFGVLNFITATTIFGSVTDITLSELSMEIFLPADAATAEAVPKLFREARGAGA
jgi:transcriptional regulator with XRE-family HTH domain